MTIKRIEIRNHTLEFEKGSYRMSHVEQHASFSRLIKIDTGCHQGLGEVVPKPTLNVEQRKNLIDREDILLKNAIGNSAHSLLEATIKLVGKETDLGGLLFGIETACMDLLARQNGKPLFELFGKQQITHIPNYVSISESSTDETLNSMQQSKDHHVVQIKVGMQSLEEDLKLLESVLEFPGSEQIILADANGGWSFDTALTALNTIEHNRLIWEEPCFTYKDNLRLHLLTNQPILFDQCVSNPLSARQAIADSVWGICIKPAFIGSMQTCAQLRDECSAKRIRYRIDGPWCGPVATAAIGHLASTADPTLLIAGCNLSAPLKTSRFPAGVSLDAGYFTLNKGIGIGLDQMHFNLTQNPEKIFT